MTLPSANIFQPLIDVFESVLLAIHGVVGSWGWSIILLTVLVRALLVPLAVKQFRSMKALAAVQPQIKELQKKYGDDKQRLNQEMMRFYQENKVNPFASCLPLIAQIPVFIALFYMLQKDLRLDICGQSERPCGTPESAFLFIPDITDKATGGVLITLILLYVGTQLLSTVLMSTQIQDKNQRYLMMGLPVVFVPFIISFPAGLLVYWITTNLWTMGQGLALRKIIGVPPVMPRDPDSPGLFGSIAKRAQEAAESKADGGAKPVKAAGNGSGNGKASASAAKAARAAGPPPPPPRRKKKQRSGRRR